MDRFIAAIMCDGWLTRTDADADADAYTISVCLSVCFFLAHTIPMYMVHKHTHTRKHTFTLAQPGVSTCGMYVRMRCKCTFGVCMFVCIYVSMRVCMYACMNTHTFKATYTYIATTICSPAT